MPRRTTAAKRYAEAIAGLARDSKQPQEWQRWRDELRRVASAFEDPVLRLSLQSPRVSAERKQALFSEKLGQGVSPHAHNLLALMARRGRLDLLPDVVTWFDDFADRALGVRHFTVTTATPLTEEQRARLRQQLGGAGGQVILEEQVDPTILGGIVVRQEDVIQDFSVRARLDNLRDHMN